MSRFLFIAVCLLCLCGVPSVIGVNAIQSAQGLPRTLTLTEPNSQISNLAKDIPDFGKHHKGHKKKKHKEFTSPLNLFIQERASKQLPGPGQHFSFGAVKPWNEILHMIKTGRKLLFVVRHGQAVSNFLSDTLGTDEWFEVEGKCSYTDKEGKDWGVFDAELTDLGKDQVSSLNSMLGNGGWLTNITEGRQVKIIVSPLSRCLQTSELMLDGLALNASVVEETCRETLGHDTCDARRSVTDPEDSNKHGKYCDCKYQEGLRTRYPQIHFPIKGVDTDGLGLNSDKDLMWRSDERERQGHQVKRAKEFMRIIFDNVEEDIVFVVTHSGFTRSLLLAVGREPYRPVNAEMVPVIVQRHEENEH